MAAFALALLGPTTAAAAAGADPGPDDDQVSATAASLQAPKAAESPEATETATPEPPATTEADPAPKADPEPAKADPAPAKTTSEPAKADPEPVKTTSEPAKADPPPATTAPEPAKADPEPVKTTDSAPATTDPEPTTADPAPATTDPTPAKADPTTAPAGETSAKAKARATAEATKASEDGIGVLATEAPEDGVSVMGGVTPGGTKVELAPDGGLGFYDPDQDVRFKATVTIPRGADGDVLVTLFGPDNATVPCDTKPLTLDDFTDENSTVAYVDLWCPVPEGANPGQVFDNYVVYADDGSGTAADANATIRVTPPIDLVKSQSSDTYAIGDTITYEIDLQIDTGDGPGYDGEWPTLTVTDALPPGLECVDVSDDLCRDGTVVLDAQGFKNHTLTITAKVTEDTGCKTNSATATYTGHTLPEKFTFKSNPVTTCPVPPKLTLKKTVSPTIVAPGGTVDYTLKLTVEKANATAVVVSDSLPTGLTPDCDNATYPTGWTMACDGPDVSFSNAGPITPTGDDPIVFIVKAKVADDAATDDPLVNTAEATADQDVTATSSAPVTVKSPAFTLVKKVAATGPFYLGDTVPFSLQFAVTQGTVTNPVVSDTVPTALKLVCPATAPSGWTIATCDDATGKVEFTHTGTWSAADGPVTFTVSTTVADDSAAQVTNTAEATATNQSTVTDDAPVTIKASKVSLVKKLAATGPFAPEGKVPFTLTLAVTEGTAVNPTVTDTVPAGLTLVCADINPPDGWDKTCDAATSELTFTYKGKLSSADAAVTFPVITTVDKDAKAETLTNSATASADNADPVTDTAPVDITLTPANFTLVKKLATSAVVNPGDTVPFTLTFDVTQGSVTDPTVSDTLPAGLLPVCDTITAALPTGWSVACSETRTALTFTYSGTVASTDDAVTLQVFAKVADDTTGTLTNIASASADGETTASDTADVTVTTPVTPPAKTPKLTLTKKLALGSPAYFEPGDTVSYVLALKVTDADAENVTIVDVLPEWLDCTKVTAPQGWAVSGCVAGSKELTLTYTGSVPAGSTVDFSIDAKVAANAKAGTYTNSATASADNAAPDSDWVKIIIKLPETTPPTQTATPTPTETSPTATPTDTGTPTPTDTGTPTPTDTGTPTPTDTASPTGTPTPTDTATPEPSATETGSTPVPVTSTTGGSGVSNGGVSNGGVGGTSSGTLPYTGADSTALLIAGVLMLVAGTVLIALRRKATAED